MDKPRVTVVGSINMDLLTSVSRLPNQGETMVGDTFEMKPGGKGANQAVAAARLGAHVSMIGKVGNDALGNDLLAHLDNENIDTSGVDIDQKLSTGIANIILYEKDNRIMIIPGANEAVTKDYVDKWKEKVLDSDMVLMQMEIPIQTIIWCADLCSEKQVPFILNPAPAIELPAHVYEKALYITPNEEEGNLLFDDSKDKYQEKLITTIGSKGASYQNSIIDTYASNVVDTTGAGDTFNGALAFFIASGLPVKDAIFKANIAASLAIEHLGAQQGMPTLKQVEERISRT
ncbi:ribokinase [Gracilibacillus ureilyticus]|uniref:Ribokinase n=1 Tax=Gracilibacillus ureilyticus TaxID=531814 RepID=A0A1H9MLT1_9BACI|nr:ribokinase [Gracilibacillus ureilyticus]SER24578.1 ribokinase [Gracilibacillus ureilyticus]